MFTLHIAGLRLYDGKSLFWEKLEYSQREMNQGTDSWVA